MSARPNFSIRFVRKTQLTANEYHKNFYKLDEEIITAITSQEADRVTPLMSKIYLRMLHAPSGCWEREGVLRFEAEWREGKHIKAWDLLCEAVGVASATANKAITWLHDQGIIGYFAGKNGVGIRIFLNRAVSSIGSRTHSAGPKILPFTHASSRDTHASRNETAFNDSFAVSEVSDSDLNPHAPSPGAYANHFEKKDLRPTPSPAPQSPTHSDHEGNEAEATSRHAGAVSVDQIVERLKTELEPCLKSAATQAAAQAAAREMASTREWFETKALPKAVRVAQSESYNLFRKYGTLGDKTQRARAELEVGRASESFTPPQARLQSEKEIMELAETCVAMHELQGKSIDVTLAEISSEGGGWLLPEDAPRVREAAQKLMQARNERR